MKIIRGLKNLKDGINGGSILTIGIFDGVHIGHRKIIREVVRRAKVLKAKSVVLTFDPHPSKILDPKGKVPSLASLEHRIRLIDSLGVDYLIILAFTRSLAAISPERFVKNILMRKLALKEIFVGENFYFGKGARASIKTLSMLSEDLGFKVRIIKPVRTDGHIISSTLIRRLIVNGAFSKASKFLGRPVSILGTVVKGLRRGRILGYPTANINPHHEAIPPSGVYAVKVKFKDRFLKGVLNIGVRPTFYKNTEAVEPTIEVHIFDFDRKIYGDDLEIIFIKKLRDERKFKNRDNLVFQIRRDEEMARKSFTK